MNWDRIQGSWKQRKGKVQQRWGHLADDDFSVIDGRRCVVSINGCLARQPHQEQMTCKPRPN